MSNAQIVALGVRLFAIWLAFYLLRQAPGLWALGARELGSGFVAIVALVTLLLVAATIALWLFPLWVARKLLPVATLDQPTPLPVDQVERAGFCLLGLWLLTDALPGLVHFGVLLAYAQRKDQFTELAAGHYADAAYAIIALLIGIWLLFGAKGLQGMLRWARTAGTGAR
jgi:hypothetical protein